MPHRRAILIAGGRHPFETWPLVACTLVAIALAFTPGLRPPSMTGALPAGLVTAWLVLLAAGGLAGLVGGHWRGGVEIGLLIEGAGVLAVGCMLTLYGLALATASPATALTASGVLAGLGAGSLHRCAQIVGELRRVDRAHVLDVPLTVPLLVDPPDGGGDQGEQGAPS